MKLYNDIKAEVSGTIAEVCVKNGDFVEFNQCCSGSNPPNSQVGSRSRSQDRVLHSATPTCDYDLTPMFNRSWSPTAARSPCG